MTIPVALTIAGSDSSGGAGIQADLKAFSALGAYGMSVIVALTAQNTQGVTQALPVPADFVVAQLDAVRCDIRIDAVKIGMLASVELVETVSRGVDDLLAQYPGLPIVLDPVMVATSGSRLLDDDAVEALRRLIPKASLITPNLPEAGVLLGSQPATTLAQMRQQAAALMELGAQRVLVKGGHGSAMDATDVFIDADGSLELLVARRIETNNTHGTGCTLSSAIAALRPQRASWLEAIHDAKSYLTEAIAHADELEIGHGPGPVHHFQGWWS
ncbi:MAG: bifunctional hydroxymethylpyrimidine kinase/phosphomethylpyrimidine kinase [Propionibacteriaceae bacterium]